jgi:hypothetical protein
MITKEVNIMDERNEAAVNEQETPGYTPRPRYQVWGARIGLFLFLIVLLCFYFALFGGKL